jgi:hypothetical protein
VAACAAVAQELSNITPNYLNYLSSSRSVLVSLDSGFNYTTTGVLEIAHQWSYKVNVNVPVAINVTG